MSEIMRLADAYADAARSWATQNPKYEVEAREALEAAIVNQQLTVEQEPVAWGTEVKYGKLFFRIGVQSFAIDYTPEDEPDCSAGNAMAWMEKRLREALSKLAHPTPEAKQEPVAWATTYMGFPNQFFKEDDAEEQAKAEIERLNREYPQDKHKRAARALYTHPAPSVNAQLLEALKSYGAHASNCDYLMLLTSLPPRRKPCSCGLHAAIAAAEKEVRRD